MKSWNLISEQVMKGVSVIVYNIWGDVGYSLDYDEDRKEIELTIWNSPYECEDKREAGYCKFNYDIKDTSFKTVKEIVSMVEDYMVVSFT